MSNIDVQAWLSKQLNPGKVSAAQALPGRQTPILDPLPRHTVLGLPLDEVPAGCEVAYFALGCYWGAEKLFWTTPGVVNTAVGFAGGYTRTRPIGKPVPAAPDTPRRSRWSSTRRWLAIRNY